MGICEWFLPVSVVVQPFLVLFSMGADSVTIVIVVIRIDVSEVAVKVSVRIVFPLWLFRLRDVGGALLSPFQKERLGVELSLFAFPVGVPDVIVRLYE